MVLPGYMSGALAKPETTHAEEGGILWEAINSHRCRLRLTPTIHTISRRDGGLPTLVGNAVRNADLLMIEANPDDPQEMKDALLLTKYGEDDNLQSHLDSTTTTLLLQRLQQYGIALKSVEKIKPWAISFLLQDLEKKRAGLGDVPSAETLLVKCAHSSHVRIETFETMRSQLSVYDRFPDRIQRALLSAYLLQNATPASTTDALERITRAWYEGNFFALMSALDALNTIPAMERREVEHETVVIRNRLFLRKTLSTLSAHPGNSIVVAVGANHFEGNDGLLRLLSQHGFEIRQV